MPIEMQERRTRYRLNDALKELLRKKPLDQIRVRELTDLCGIRRQSFYYHFTDVYDLFDWSVRQERELLARRQDGCLTLQQALWDLLRHTEEDQAYYLALWKSRGHAGIRQVLGGAVEGLMEKALAYYGERQGQAQPSPEREVHVQCGTMVLLALLEAWICGDLEQPPETLCAMLEAWARQAVLGAAWQRPDRWQRA
ncbi:hypothetical protein [uncultured Oscillibacter sp.]|uniref:hypothetical protein n=1 Tax=uncultured Oscillibacter sp. TaxID=876091 RepID=UPI0025EAEDE3|nr:hypothetical protein [uncultured Oscillibacter sp.]